MADWQGRGSRFNVTFSKGTTHKNLQNIRIEKKTGKKDYSDVTTWFDINGTEDNYRIEPKLYMGDGEIPFTYLTSGVYRLTAEAEKASPGDKTITASTTFKLYPLPRTMTCVTNTGKSNGVIFYNPKKGGKNTFEYQIEDYSDETKPLTSGSFATKVTAVVEDAAHNQLAKTTASAKKGVVKVTLKKGFEIPAGNRIYVTTKVGDTTDEKLMDTVSFLISTTPVDIKTIKATRYGNPLENNTITWEVRSDIVLNAYDKKGDMVPYNLVKFTSSDPSLVSIDAAGKVTVNAPSGTKKDIKITAIMLDGSSKKKVVTTLKLDYSNVL